MTATLNFPNNVKGFDWTKAPMDGPPAERTHIGYFCWCDTSDEDNYRSCRRDYYVLPDGSAECVSSESPFQSGDDQEVKTDTQTLAPGTWRVEYPTTTFGSRGGCWIESAE